VEFLKSDWYDRVPRAWQGGAFDLIASNPPYIAAADPHLDEGDVRFEPERSLSPGGDGLGAIRKIVAGAPERLAAGGTLAVEHGYDQSEAVREMFVAAGFANVVAYRDLAGIPRVTAGIAAA
jgi:release factor glutamine methyltransferase